MDNLNFTSKLTVDTTDFKKGMNEATDSIKLSNKEFAASVAGLGKWSDSVEGLGAKVKNLTETEKEQVKILEIKNKQYEAGIVKLKEEETALKKTKKQKDEAVKLYGKESKEVLKLDKVMVKQQKTIIKTEESQKKLSTSIRMSEIDIKKTRNETEKWNKTLNEVSKSNPKGILGAAKSIKKVGDESKKTEGKVSSLSVAIGNLSAKAVISLGKGAVKAGKDLFKMGEDFLQYSEDTLKASDNLGISTDVAQSWAHAMKKVGIEQASGEAALKKSLNDIRAARKGTGRAFDLYSKTVKNFKKMDDTDVLSSLMKNLADIPNKAERSAKAVEFFGDSAQDMMKLLENGSYGFEKSINALGEVDGIIKRDSLEAAKSAKNAMAEMKAEVGALVGSIRVKLGESMVPIFDTVTMFFRLNKERIGKMISELISGFSELMVSLGPLLIDLLNIIVKLLPTVVDLANVLGPVLGGAFKFLADNGDIVMPIIAGLVTIFKVIIPLIKAYNVVAGLAGVATLGITWPVVAVVAAIGALVAIIILVVKNWDKLVKAFTNGAKKLGEIVSKTFESFGTIFKKAGDEIGKFGNFIKDLFVNLISSIVELPNKIKNIASDVVNVISTMFSDMVQKGKDGAMMVVDSIISKFNELKDKIKTLGKDIVVGLWEGIKSMGGWIKDNVSGFFGGVLGGIGKVFGWNSPAKELIALGKDIDRGLVIGVESESKKSTGKISKTFDSILGTINGKKELELGFAGAGNLPQYRATSQKNDNYGNRRTGDTNSQVNYNIENTYNVKGEMSSAEIYRKQHSQLERIKRKGG